MSHEVPQHIGELSRYVLQESIDRVDEALRDAPQQLRDAVSVIRLVTNAARREPWYGVTIDAEDSSITVGVMMRNMFEAVGDCPDGDRPQADHWFTKMYWPRFQAGRREYRDFLLHLTDPERWERETAERRLSAERAAAIRRTAELYVRGE